MAKLYIFESYRWMVFIRCCLSIFGGYIIASLSVPLIALLFPEHLALATYSALMLSFTIWLAVIVIVFSIKELKSAVAYILISILFMFAFVTILKWWRL